MKYVELAMNSFLNTGTRFPREIIWAMGLVKYSAAKANLALGLLDEEKAKVIMGVSLQVSKGDYDDKVIVDVFQTGSGTGINMNINELISDIVKEKYGLTIHPNDHVNLGQSSNDVVPTAIRIAALSAVYNDLIPSIKMIISSLDELIKKVRGVVKPGRTHLRDALPITFDQELNAYKDAFSKNLNNLNNISENLKSVPIGGTAVGTGFNTHPDFSNLVIQELNKITRLDLRIASSKFRAMRTLTDIVSLSGIIRATALDLMRMSQDIRLMYSGPFTGIGEIDIKQEIIGSSIMPGKKNPVTVEAVMQAVCQVVGLDYSITMAATLGELELNMGIPLIGYNIQREIKLLNEALNKTSKNVIKNMVVNRTRCMNLALKSPALITVISPIVGYNKASEVANKVLEGQSIEEALRSIGIDEKTIKKIMDLRRWTRPGFPALD